MHYKLHMTNFRQETPDMRDYSYRAMRDSPSLTTLELAPNCGIMQLRLGDTIYTERLASFLESLGQATIVSGPNEIELLAPDTGKAGDMARREIAIYLRVWSVLYPDAEVSVVGEGAVELAEAQAVSAS
jgi:hypothetical protein